MIKVGLVSLIYFHFLDVFNECHPNIGKKLKLYTETPSRAHYPFSQCHG